MTNAADALNKAINKPTPGQPRQIRAQVGLTEDPLPEGKTVAKPELVLPFAFAPRPEHMGTLEHVAHEYTYACISVQAPPKG